MLGVLVFGMLPGLLIAIVVSLLLMTHRVSRPHIAVSPDNSPVPVLRVESPVFFANADRVRAAVTAAAQQPGVQAVVLDCVTVPSLDVTATRMLTELTAQLRRRGIRLVIARDPGHVVELAARSSNSPAFYPTVQDAVERLQADQ
jgi:SulP family sulfate permease